MGRSDEEHTRPFMRPGEARPSCGGTGGRPMPTRPEQNGQRLTRRAWGSRLSEVTAWAAPSLRGRLLAPDPGDRAGDDHEEDAGMIHFHLCAGRPVRDAAAAVPRGRAGRTVR